MLAYLSNAKPTPPMDVKIRTVNTNLLILLIYNEFRRWALSSQIAQKLCVPEKLIYPAKYVGEKY
jgi:hypothetical protein